MGRRKGRARKEQGLSIMVIVSREITTRIYLSHRSQSRSHRLGHRQQTEYIDIAAQTYPRHGHWISYIETMDKTMDKRYYRLLESYIESGFCHLTQTIDNDNDIDGGCKYWHQIDCTHNTDHRKWISYKESFERLSLIQISEMIYRKKE